MMYLKKNLLSIDSSTSATIFLNCKISEHNGETIFRCRNKTVNLARHSFEKPQKANFDMLYCNMVELHRCKTKHFECIL